MKKLKLQFSIFYIVIISIFLLIVLTEKLYSLMNNKVDEKLNKYIKEKYPDIKIKSKKTIYKNTKFLKIVENKDNSNLSFKIYYKNKKITDTYKKDYQEGYNFIKYIEKKIEKEIYNKTKLKYKININNKFNNFTPQVQKILLKEKNLTQLNIYTINLNTTTNFNLEDIYNNIININKNFENNNIIPKNYNVIITDSKNITKSIQINNLKPEVIKNNMFIYIINDIIQNKKSKLIKEYEINYKYLN